MEKHCEIVNLQNFKIVSNDLKLTEFIIKFATHEAITGVLKTFYGGFFTYLQIPEIEDDVRYLENLKLKIDEI